MNTKDFWTPAFAGVTAWRTSCETVNIIEPNFTTLICQGEQMRPPFGPLQKKNPFTPHREGKGFGS